MNKPADPISRFDQLYSVLNPAQRKAVDTIEGPVIVIAGPGTGKTTLLTLRVANILRQTDTAPEQILALTFTESGAYAMRRKLVEIIGNQAYKVNIHTFHGFAENVVAAYPDYFPRIIGSAVITEAEQISLIRTVLDSGSYELLRPYGDPAYYIKPILHEIHLLKRETVSPEALREAAETDDEKYKAKNSELAAVYEAYEKLLAKRKLYDFDDMLLECIRAMEEQPEFKLMLQESYQYVLADEHQDANASQNRILELLSDFHESPNLFIVGDDKQAIYRFQGASLDNFLYFAKKYSSATVVELTHNYRSHQGILDAAHSLIRLNPGVDGKKPIRLISLQVGTKPIFIDESPNTERELEYVALIISRLIKRGEKAEEIAVLYRENKQAEGIAAALRARGVPFRVESDQNMLEEIDIVKIIMICRAIADLADEKALSEVLLVPELGCDPIVIAGLLRQAGRGRASFTELLEHVDDAPIKAAMKWLREWASEARVLPITALIQRIMDDTGYMQRVLTSVDSLNRLSVLETFFRQLKSIASTRTTFRLNDFLEYIDIMNEYGIRERRSKVDEMPGVRLMTVHRSKGLEFNHVFIIHAIDGSWGNRTKRQLFHIPLIDHARDAGRLEDERRLFYVALTRARESVTISYALSRDDRPTMASQFIQEMDPALLTIDKPQLNPLDAHSPFLDTDEKSKSVALPTNGVLQRDFVRNAFISQPLSVTHLNNFRECAWKYFFVNLIRIPQAESKYQLYGTAIHAVLRARIDAAQDGRMLDRKKLLDLFQHQLDALPFSARDRAECSKKGKKALEGYFKTHPVDVDRRILTEYKIKGVTLSSQVAKDTTIDISLTGNLDMVELLANDAVNVTDWKTGKPKSRNELMGKTKDSDGNYFRQLAFYKLLVDGDAKWRMNCGLIDFIEPTATGSYRRESFEISAEDVAKVKQDIAEMATSIYNLSFITSACDDKACEFCRLGNIVSRAAMVRTPIAKGKE